MNLNLLRDSIFYVITKLFRFWKELCISYPSIDYVLDSIYISSEASNLVVTHYGVETRKKLLTVSLPLQDMEMEYFPFITLKGILSILRRVYNLIISDESLFMVANAFLPLYALSHFRRTDIKLKFLSLVQDFIPISVCQVTIDLSGCVRLAILTFFTLARYFPSIEEVHIENSCFRTKDCFHNGVKNPRITIVNLASNMYLDDKSLMNIAFTYLSMEILDVIVISAVGSTLNDGPGHDWKYLFCPDEMKLGWRTVLKFPQWILAAPPTSMFLCCKF
ncbi:hypothetical protein H5410_001469 [Solanum commersonii]|uniref:Uncharacterized protein n=1 Tax=Solanum commersonii TaxID=4109 RepID=A0A9J6AZ51_SOLCO|nr:hypothetical protein H5410_001469 [Solanum commersonii]